MTGFAVCGIQTNPCVETTAHTGGNLGCVYAPTPRTR
jgi:nicotinamidase-related amidase